jgi:NitT/TauT family transport system substrate-binding protein
VARGGCGPRDLGSVTQALSSRAFNLLDDIASASPDPSQFNAIARGIDIKLVETTSIWVPGSNVSALVVRQALVDSGRYKTPADLKGMTISIPNLNSSASWPWAG